MGNIICNGQDAINWIFSFTNCASAKTMYTKSSANNWVQNAVSRLGIITPGSRQGSEQPELAM